MRRTLPAFAVCVALAAAAPAGAAKTPLPGVRTPSGNIQCLFVPGSLGASLHCEIRSASYATRLQNRCMKVTTVDWHGFELARTGKSKVICSGGILYNPDTQRPAYRTLAYGKTWTHGGFTCVSATTGLTCRNPASHGIFISRESWRAW